MTPTLRLSITDRMTAPDREALLARCRRTRHAPGDVLFTEGAAAQTLHLMVSGRVLVNVTTPHGDCATLAVLGPGETFGEVALVSSPPLRSATVTALDRCETLVLHRRDLEELRRTRPGVDAVLLDLLAGQVRRLTELLIEALHLPAEQRVLRRLAELAQGFAADGGTAAAGTGATGGIPVPVTQDMLAAMAGTSRVTANQVLQRLQRSGRVVLGRGLITVPDLPSLQRAATDVRCPAGVPAPLSRRAPVRCDGR